MRIFHKDVRGYDILPDRGEHSLESVMECDIIFLALPTNLLPDGTHLDSKPIEDTLFHLVSGKYSGLVVLKSTLPFGFYQKAKVTYAELNIIHCPEILHVEAPVIELVNPQYMVVGRTIPENLIILKNAFHWVPDNKFKEISPNAAAVYKLIQNSFACTKISFVNEVERFCKEQDIDPEEVLGVLRLDKRCADEYSYPNKGAYSGFCLPKDIQELISSYPDNILFTAVKEVNERIIEENKD